MARPRQFEEQAVVAQAMDVFWTKGFRQTTPRDLLEATGLSKSSLYNTFGSKQELFLRAIFHYTDFQIAFLEAMLDRPTLRESLTELYDRIIESLRARAGEPPRACLACTTAMEVADDEPEIADALDTSRLRVHAVFAARLRRAANEGELPPSRDPDILAHFVLSNNMGIAVLARSGAPESTLRHIANIVIDTVCA